MYFVFNNSKKWAPHNKIFESIVTVWPRRLATRKQMKKEWKGNTPLTPPPQKKKNKRLRRLLLSHFALEKLNEEREKKKWINVYKKECCWSPLQEAIKIVQIFTVFSGCWKETAISPSTPLLSCTLLKSLSYIPLLILSLRLFVCIGKNSLSFLSDLKILNDYVWGEENNTTNFLLRV